MIYPKVMPPRRLVWHEIST